LSGHKDEITVCAWSPDNLFLATGSLDRTAILWDLVNKEQLAVLRAHSGDETYTAGGHRVVWGAIKDIAWSPNGEMLATAGSDRLLMVWSLKTLGKYRTLVGHIGPIDSCRWSRDGKRIISEGGSFEHIVDEATLLWDVQRGCELGRLSPDDPELEAPKKVYRRHFSNNRDFRTAS
jgi:WD40 repeat protein